MKPGDQLYPNELDRLRACLALPTLFDEPGFPPQAFAERAREIVAAHDHFHDRLKAAQEHPDVVAAEAEKDARGDVWRELAERLSETRAKTVDGMIAKLAMVAIDMVYEVDSLGGDYDGIAASAALDAVRLRAAAKAWTPSERREGRPSGRPIDLMKRPPEIRQAALGRSFEG